MKKNYQSLLLLLPVLLVLPLTSLGQESKSSPTVAIETPDTVDKDYSSELPRFEPLSVDEAKLKFEVLDGFRIELVAAEPLVFDPVAFAFDAKYRLYVVEMRDYSVQETEHLGSIALLEDTTGDGLMDKRTTFVEGLSWPTAIWPWKDGVLVAEPPRITWYRDIDGDGKSDQKEDWFVGFGRGNVQGLVNSLRWGVDGYVHGATSSSDAQIEQLQVDETAAMELRRRDFVMDPTTRTLRAAAGGGQHGMSFNRWGDKFVTSNSDHLQQIVDLEWWSHSNSPVPLPATRRSIAVDGPQAEVFRASPIEPWRIVRTRLRMSGVAPGVVEGGGRAAGYFTGATGTWLFDSHAGFDDGVHDTAIVCDVGSNLVHRKRMTDQGIFWSGERIDAQAELLRSRDTWFRPVQLGDGPDGSLIIADMYREVIEHPKSLPPMIKRHLDLTSGRDRGRIWRLVPMERAASATESNDLRAPSDLSVNELVARLSHPIAWQRRMASQLLVERNAEGGQRELLQAAVSATPEAQVLAMHVAHRLGWFNEPLARQLLKAEHPRVLQHAIRLTGQNDLADDLAEEIHQLAGYGTARVQLELALLASRLQPDVRRMVLKQLFRSVEEPMPRAVLATAAGNTSWQLFDEAADQLSDSARSAWLELLLPGWATQIRNDPLLRNWFVDQLTGSQDVTSMTWLVTLSNASAVTVGRLLAALTRDQRQSLNNRITELLERGLGQSSTSLTDFRVLRLATMETRRKLADELLQPNSPEAAQRSVIELIAWVSDSRLAELVIERFSSLTPALQAEGLRALAVRSETLVQLADALAAQQLRPAQIPLEVRAQLLRIADKELATRFSSLLGNVSSDRQAVIDRYATDLADINSAAATTVGLETFRRVCAQCHQLGDIGSDVGPPLKQLGEKSPQQLLEAILDPNREVDPKYAGYSIMLVDGRVLTGIIDDESAGQITLKEAGGKLHKIARTEIDQIKNSGLSLMPIGIEESITPEQMTQLIGFLKTATLNAY